MKGVILIEKYVPLWEKANLTLEEASMYFGIGQNKIRELTNSDNCLMLFGVVVSDLLSESYLRNI